MEGLFCFTKSSGLTTQISHFCRHLPTHRPKPPPPAHLCTVWSRQHRARAGVFLLQLLVLEWFAPAWTNLTAAVKQPRCCRAMDLGWWPQQASSLSMGTLLIRPKESIPEETHLQSIFTSSCLQKSISCQLEKPSSAHSLALGHPQYCSNRNNSSLQEQNSWKGVGNKAWGWLPPLLYKPWRHAPNQGHHQRPEQRQSPVSGQGLLLSD